MKLKTIGQPYTLISMASSNFRTFLPVSWFILQDGMVQLSSNDMFKNGCSRSYAAEMLVMKMLYT